jgi:hypothetical protein
MRDVEAENSFRGLREVVRVIFGRSTGRPCLWSRSAKASSASCWKSRMLSLASRSRAFQSLDRTERACRASWYPVAPQFRGTLAVPGKADEPAIGHLPRSNCVRRAPRHSGSAGIDSGLNGAVRIARFLSSVARWIQSVRLSAGRLRGGSQKSISFDCASNSRCEK